MNDKTKKSLKTLVIVLFMIIGTFEGLFFYFSSLVKPESYETQILDAIKKQTGQDVKIKGGVGFSLLPKPSLVISDLVIGAASIPDSPTQTPVFYIRSVKIDIALGSLLSDKIELSEITMNNPTLLLQRSEDNIIHWDWLDTKLLHALNTRKGSGISLPVNIFGGSIKYQDIANNKNVSVENVEAHSVFGDVVSFNGSMQILGRSLQFVIDSKSPEVSLKDTEFPLNMNISEALGSALQIQTVIETSEETPKISGKFNFSSSDVYSLFDIFIKNTATDNANKTIMPFKLGGNWYIEDGVIKLNNLLLDGLNSKGTGSATIGWNKWYPSIGTELNFEYIDYLIWNGLIESRVLKKPAVRSYSQEDDELANYDLRKDNPLPENIELRLDIRAKKIIFNKEEWKDIHLNAILENGTFTINQCDLLLDGDGSLTIFGVVSQGGTGSLRFEGNIEAQGKSLRKAIAMFYSAGRDLPPVSLGEFNVRANMYIISGQIRLFETTGTFDGTDLEGTITIFLESIIRVESDLKLKNVNFDYIRDEIINKKSAEKNKKKKDQKEVISFDWLKYLSIRFDAKVVIDGFTFMEKKGDKASFSLYAFRGDLRLSDFQLQYPENTDVYNCNIDVRGKIPYINLMVNADKIDTNYFNLSAESEDKVELSAVDSEKSLLDKSNLEKAVPLEWMEDFNGVIDLSVRNFIHRNLAIDKIKLQAKLDNRKVTIQKFGFVFSQAQSYITGSVFGGKVPGINISFTMANADIYEVIQPITGFTNISGFANLSGNLNTSGWNFLEWINNSDSKLLITARGVKVQGINIEGIRSVIDVARSSADVYNNVNNILTKGSTEFAVDGALNIREGELRSPGLALKTSTTTAIIVGGMKLDSLEGQFSSTYSFPGLSFDNSPPILIIQLTGNMQKPEIKVDTASLEAYVAKRNIKK